MAINVKPTMRTLRKITAFLILPGLPLIIPTAVKGYPVILAGLAPYSLSFILWVAHSQCERHERAIPTGLAVVLDLFTTLAYMGSLLPMWTGPGSALHKLTGYWKDHSDILILFSYASSVFVANMIIHLVLGLMGIYLTAPKSLQDLFRSSQCSRCRNCPRCSAEEDEERRPMISTGKAPISITNEAQYSLLGDAEETPRPSEEADRPSEETIREV